MALNVARRKNPTGIGKVSVSARSPLWLTVALAASGCVAYAPKPVQPLAIASAQQTRTLLDPEVCVELHRLSATKDCTDTNPDRLDLLAAAIALNPAVAASTAAVRTAETDAAAARVRPSAVLTLSAEYANDPTTSSPWLYGLAVDQPLDLGQRRKGRVQLADAKVALARLDRLEALWTLRMTLRKAESDLAAATQERSAFSELVALRERQLAAANRRLTEGEISRAEVDRLRAEASSDTTRRLDAERRRSAALADLSGGLGVPVAQLASLTLGWPDFGAPARLSDGEIGALSAAATAGRPAILRAMVEYDQSETTLRTAVGEQFPALNVSVGYTWERGLVKLPASIGLALPPADLNRAAIRAAEAGRTEAGARLEEAVHKVGVDIDAARVAYRSAWNALDTIRTTTLITAQSLAAQADREIEAGAIDRVDWASAQIASSQARLDELTALAQVRLSESQLEDALRTPLSGPEQAVGLQTLQNETRR